MQSYVFSVSNWQFLNEGEMHCVLSYSGKDPALIDKVLILEKEDVSYPEFKADSTLPANTRQSMEIIYEAFISSFKPILPYMAKRQKIDVEKTKKEQFVEKLMEKIQPLRKLAKQKVRILPQKDIFLQQNLYYLQPKPQRTCTVFLELKPKSCLYDQYTIGTVNQICQSLGLNLNNALQVLEKAPEVQKTKWFKKSLSENIKHKLNPKSLFDNSGSNFLKDAVTIKIHPEESSIPITNQEFDEIINEYLKQTRLMDLILCLQMRYYKPGELFNINADEISKLIEKSNIKRLASKLSAQINEDLSRLQKDGYIRKPINSEELESDILAQIMRCLIAASWKDVSFIAKVTLVKTADLKDVYPDQITIIRQVNKIYSSVNKITVIDYDLKPFNRVRGLATRDKKYLQNYLKKKFNK